MAVVLDRAQRDAVYRFVVLDLPNLGDIVRELEHGNPVAARRLRRRFDEDVRLLDLLDWGETGSRESYALTMPREEVKAIFTRLHARIMSDIEEAMSALLGHPVSEALEVAGICTRVMRSLRVAKGGERHACRLHEVPRRPHCA